VSVRKHNSNMHKGHRQRVFKKFHNMGFDYFPIHEILEMSLFFIVPYRDTNPLAHNLLSHFGSFHKVFDADYSELLKFGVSDNIASYLNYLPEISDYYMSDKLKVRNTFVFPEQIQGFLKNKYIKDNVITTYVVLTDINDSVLFCGAIAKGEVNKKNFPIQRLLELCVIYNAQRVIISHNYPDSFDVPHKVDEKLSEYISIALKGIKAKLFGHYISVRDDDIIIDEDEDFKEKFETLKKFLTFLTRNKEIDDLCKSLIETFGSVSGIFDASISALKEAKATDGIINYIKFIPAFTRVYMEDKRKDRFKVVTPDMLCSFFRYKYIGRSKEVIYVLLLDEKYRVLYCDIVTRGSLSSAEIPLKSIIELCLVHKAKYVVLSHNHPHTTSIPSEEDVIATGNLKMALKNINLVLLDHIIVSATDETAFSSTQFKNLVGGK